MWPRMVEILIAIWLAASPFVLGHIDEHPALSISDIACGVIIAASAVISFSEHWRRMHLGELAVAAWLLGFGYLGSSEPLPGLQNDILVALVLMMFAIIPSEANRPPRSWRTFEFEKTH